MNYTSSEISQINEYLKNNKILFNKEIGEKISIQRKIKNIKISELAEKCMMSSIYLIQIEEGKYNISLSKFISICNGLELYPNELLEEFLVGCKKKEDEFYYIYQNDKNISKNIFDFMKYQNLNFSYNFFK